MVFGALVLIELILLTCTGLLIKENEELFKLLAMVCTLFFIKYSVVSGLLFLFDAFSFTLVLGVNIIIALISIIILHVKYKKRINSFKISVDGLLLIIILVSLIFTIEKYEMFSVGQDQGVYQALAVELVYGNTDLQYDFPEYDILVNEEDKVTYRELLNSTFNGYNVLIRDGLTLENSEQWNYTTVEFDDIYSDVSGVYHGVQTYSAMLALMGVLFGIANMMQLQTLFYLIALIFIYHTIKNFSESKWICFTSTAIFAFSPLAIWVSKSSFTEMYLTVLIAAYVYMVTNKKNENYKWVLGLPLISFAFVHVSFLIIYPIFVLLHLILYVREKNKQYLIANGISAVALSVGYYMMANIAAQYFYDNCSRLYIGNIITMNNFLYWIYFASAVVCIVSLLVAKFHTKIEQILEKSFIPYIVPVSSVFFILIIGINWVKSLLKISINTEGFSVLGKIYHYGREVLLATQYTSIFGFAIATGLFIIPLLLVFILLKSKRKYEDGNYWILELLFLYMILFQCAFMRKSVIYYYYYSRYLVFYIPIICALWTKVILHYKNKILMYAVVPCCLIVMMYYNITLIQYKDDSYIEWDVLVDMIEVIEEDSAFIASNDTLKTLGLPLRAASGAAMFPIMSDIEAQVDLLEDNYEHIYFVTISSSNLEDLEAIYPSFAVGLDIDAFDIVYRVEYEKSDFISGVAYPTNVTINENTVTIYEYIVE